MMSSRKILRAVLDTTYFVALSPHYKTPDAFARMALEDVQLSM